MRSHRQGSWSRYLKSTAIAASLMLAGCGLRPTNSTVQGDETASDDLSLTGASPTLISVDDQGKPKMSSAPIAYPCESSNSESRQQRPIPGLTSTSGAVEVHLRSSAWSNIFEETLFKAEQSSGVGAGFRILGTEGGQSPVSAPWLNLDELVILTLNKELTIKSPRILKTTSDGIVDLGRLEFRVKPFPIKTSTGPKYSHKATLKEPLEPGLYRIVFNEKEGGEIFINVQPGDVDQSFSVNAIDREFISRNINRDISSARSLAFTFALTKADLNGDGIIQKQDLETFQLLHPNSTMIIPDFLGEPLSTKSGDIAEIRIRGSHWNTPFQRTLGSDIGFKIAPASCLRSLPWSGMNQILIKGNKSPPLFDSITLTRISDGKDFGNSATEKITRIGDLSILMLRSPLSSGVYQLKISVRNMGPSIDGVVTRIIKFRVLEGDIDGSYRVDKNDLAAINQFLPKNARPTMTSFVSNRSDINGDGRIDTADQNLVMRAIGQVIIDPSIPAPAITEVNKVHVTDENGDFMPGIISASINGRVVGKTDLNGRDPGEIKITGPKDSKVLWSNSLNGDTLETVLDGVGDYDGRGHYITFRWRDTVVPSVNPGEYQTPQVVALSNQTPGSQIIYSLDGSELSPNVSTVYSEPLVINQTSSLRVAIVRNGKILGTPKTTFIYVIKPEVGGCGRHFGETAGSFSSTRDECFMKQEEIDTICKDFSGKDYKVEWVRFNSDSTIKEVVNLQSGACPKLQNPPTTDSDTPEPDLPPTLPEFGDVSFDIIRQGQSSKFQVCINASVNGQPEVQLACNRPAPGQQYSGDEPSVVNLKMQKDTCNTLKLSMYVRPYPSENFKMVPSRVFDAASRPSAGPGISVEFLGGAFSIMANDNMDTNWNDLAFILKNRQPGLIKLKIEGSSGGCN